MAGRAGGGARPVDHRGVAALWEPVAGSCPGRSTKLARVIVLWQTVSIQAALDHLAAKGYPIDPADVARLTPLGHPTINLDGRYRTTNRPPATGLRPLRIN